MSQTRGMFQPIVRRTISWDVGSRNLAFCMLERQFDSCPISEISVVEENGYLVQRFSSKIKYRDKVRNWGLIDLLAQYNFPCYQCGKLAKWQTYETKIAKKGSHLKKASKTPKINDFNFNDVSDNIIYSCGVHVKGVIPLKVKNDCLKCNKRAKWQVQRSKKQMYCDAHKPYERVTKCKRPIGSTFPISTLKTILLDELQKHPEFLLVDWVVIENQPSHLTPKMKALSETLYHWFLIRSRYDSDQYPNLIKSVEFMNPNTKLPNSRKMPRPERKAKVMALAENNTRGTGWWKFYKNHPKKDDLADSRVQGEKELDDKTIMASKKSSK
jgi:hypothetical protein